MKISSSLSEVTIKKLTEPWEKIILTQESGSILHAALRDQLYRVPGFIDNFSRKYKSKKIKLIPLHVSILPAEDPNELNNYLKKLLKTKYRQIVLMVIGADLWLDKRPEMLATIDAHTHDNHRKISALYFFRKNITEKSIRTNLSHLSSLYQNISIYPYLEPSEVKHFIGFYEKQFGIRLTAELKSKIIDECGGSMWLAKEAIREYKKSGSDNIFNHKEIVVKLDTLYQEFSIEEKQIMDALASGDKYLDGADRSIVEFLQKSNAIGIKRKTYFCKIPLLKKFITSKIDKSVSFKIQEKCIQVNGLLVDSIFTERENDLLKVLIENPNNIVTRTEAAHALWKIKSGLYSDWSLDMAVNRLRNKLQKLGINRKIIKTIKKKGYSLNSQL